MKYIITGLLVVCVGSSCGKTQLSGTSLTSQVSSDAGLSVVLDTGIPSGDSGVQLSISNTDPACLDGQYREAFARNDIDVSDIIANFTPDTNGNASAKALMVDILSRRFPLGAYLIEQGTSSGAFKDCPWLFVNDLTSVEDIINGVSGAVHECGHSVDLKGDFGTYVFTESLQFSCSGGSHYNTPAPPAQSLLRNDEFVHLWPPCLDNQYSNCDFYAASHWTHQSMSSLLEELLQYVNDIAASYAVYDLSEMPIIEREGALTMLWWLQRYLRIMRTDPTYSNVYEQLLGSTCWQEMILSVWGRAWLFLDATAALASNDDREIQSFIEDPTLLEEIDRIRVLSGCKSSLN